MISHDIYILYERLLYLKEINPDITPDIRMLIYENIEIINVLFFYKQYRTNKYITHFWCISPKDNEVLQYLIENNVIEVQKNTITNRLELHLTNQSLLNLL